MSEDRITNEMYSKAAAGLHGQLAAQGIRVFVIHLNSGTRDYNATYLIHPNRTVAQWREDIRSFQRTAESHDPDGSSSDGIFNGLYRHLEQLGYLFLHDVVADVYEGRVTNLRSTLIDDPDHEEQPTGFGHYGHETRPPQ